MRRCFAALFALALAASGAFAAAGAPAELAVAIRYLQAEGTSHAHIYLYREDGKLLRQLTKDDSGQDFDPIFAPDGQTIVFRREKKSGAIEFWSIDPLGRAQKQLPAAPEWYTSAEDAPFFTNADLEPDPSPETSPAPTAVPGAAEPEEPPRTYLAPDGSVEVVVRRLASDEEDSINGEGTGKHFLIRDLRAGEEKEMGTLPGFVGLWDVIHRKGDMEQVYLFEGELRLSFSASISTAPMATPSSRSISTIPASSGSRRIGRRRFRCRGSLRSSPSLTIATCRSRGAKRRRIACISSAGMQS